MEFIAQPRRRKFLFNNSFTLTKMFPTFVVDGTDRARIQHLRRLHAILRIHRKTDRTCNRETGSAQMENPHADSESLCHFFNAMIKNRIACDVQRAVLLTFSFEHKANRLPCERADK